MIESRSTDSLASFLNSVSKVSNEWKLDWIGKRKADDGNAAAWLPWFRGEENGEWLATTALQPKLYRNKYDIKAILDHEQEMRVEFRRRGAQLLTERQPIDKWEWYFLMQHHHAPTRLLDWSDAALVGLYFAVSKRCGKDDKHGDADAAVYMLDPWWLNEAAFKEVSPVSDEYRPVGPALPDWDEAKPYLPDEFDNDEVGLKCPLAIDPSHFSRRVAAQRSRFTIFGRQQDGLKGAQICSENRLIKFDVKRSAIPEIKRDLRLAGISEDTIFPDLERLGRELSFWFEVACEETKGSS